jgi:hypothetical protein
MRRLIFVLPFALAALVAGCNTPDAGASGSASPSAAPATSAPADLVETIQQAMERSLGDTVAIEAKVGAGGQSIELKGVADPAAKTVQVSGKAPEPIEARIIGDIAYIKDDSMASGKPWMKLDMTKLRPQSTLRQSFDMRTQTGIVGGIVTAEEVGGGKYRGTADLAKAAQAAATDAGMKESLESMSKLAQDPSAIPFEATVDTEGRLTAMSYDIATKSAGTVTTEMALSGFGEPVTVSPPPAADTEEASPEVYAIL